MSCDMALSHDRVYIRDYFLMYICPPRSLISPFISIMIKVEFKVVIGNSVSLTNKLICLGSSVKYERI